MDAVRQVESIKDLVADKEILRAIDTFLSEISRARKMEIKAIEKLTEYLKEKELA